MPRAKGVKDSSMISTEELYMFDLNGYLVVKNAISRDDLTEMNDIITADRALIEKGRSMVLDPSVPHFAVPFVQHAVFRFLIDSNKIVPYKEAFMGDGAEYGVCFFF